MSARVWITKELVEERSIPVPESGCWLWDGEMRGNGYGAITSCGKRYSAHRASWTVHHGAIPDGLIVCHRCDTRTCVNPDHLFLGSHQDNSDDKLRKGRARNVAGERHGRAKLTEAQVRSIRCDPRSAGVIARDYGISRASVSGIKTNRVWKNVLMATKEPRHD